MKNFIVAAALLLGVSLGGCAQLQTLENNVGTVWHVVTTASVSPTQIIIASNTYDALEGTATQFLGFCKTPAGASQAACSLSNRKKVIQYVRAGRAARNALEPYVISGSAGPSALYNTLMSVISALQSSNLPTSTGG